MTAHSVRTWSAASQLVVSTDRCDMAADLDQGRGPQNVDFTNQNGELQLVGGVVTILKNMNQWDDIPYMKWTIRNVWNQQPELDL